MPNDAKWGDENCDWKFFRAVHERMRADDEEVFRQNMFKVKLNDDDHIIIFVYSKSKSGLNIFNNMNYQWDWEVLIWVLVIELNSYPNI